MRTHKWILAAMMTVALAIVGCNKQASVDTSALEKSFKSAEATLQSSADKAVAAVKSGDYSGAMNELKGLASNAKLTPEQKQAITDVIAQVEKAIADAAAKAKGDATKAADDLKKSMPK